MALTNLDMGFVKKANHRIFVFVAESLLYNQNLLPQYSVFCTVMQEQNSTRTLSTLL